MTDEQRVKYHMIKCMANLLEATIALQSSSDKNDPELSHEFEQLIAKIDNTVNLMDKAENPIALVDDVIAKCCALDVKIRLSRLGVK